MINPIAILCFITLRSAWASVQKKARLIPSLLSILQLGLFHRLSAVLKKLNAENKSQSI